MPKRSKFKVLKFIPGKGFEKLVKDLNSEFQAVENFVRDRTIEGVKKAGRFIQEHILQNKDRADYGTTLFPELAKKTGKSESFLYRILKFYRTNAILAAPPELTWEHCRLLMTVPSETERKALQKKTVDLGWTSKQLRQYLSSRRTLERVRNTDGPIPQLKFERGLLYTYQIVERPTLKDEGRSFIDCGFNIWNCLESASRFKAGDIVESSKDEEGNYSLKKSDRQKKDLYTFKAIVERVVDGDTLWVEVDLGFDSWRCQELRLRGIDCPEMSTKEGQLAKRFIESRLKPHDFVVIKTYKDDKYKRMLVDIFYLPKAGNPQRFDSRSESAGGNRRNDPQVVASEGIFLNQELLDNRLAVIWR